MMKSSLIRTILLAALVGFFAPLFAQAGDVVVIVNKANSAPVNKAEVQKIYLGKTAQWPDGSSVVALDLPESNPTRSSFAVGVLGRSLANLKALWTEKMFS